MKKKIIMRFEISIFLLVNIGISNCFENKLNENKQWNHYKRMYHKCYNNRMEELNRKKIFLKNLQDITAHNAKFHQNLETYEKGVNIFTDMEFSEFKRTYLGFNATLVKSDRVKSNSHENVYEISKRRSIQIPKAWNWVEKGFATRVKMQGRCNSCYAFSAVGSVESQLYIHSNRIVELSAQQVVDCSTPYRNMGCESGHMSQTFNYLIKYGIESEADYPYVGIKNNCSFDASKVATKISGYVQLPSGDENILMEAIANVGPMSAVMEVTPNTIQFVGKSVFYDRLCNNISDILNHAVLIVGYGSVNGTDYWLIKNSWGDSFGDNGYAKIARNMGNHCQIATEVYFPIM